MKSVDCFVFLDDVQFEKRSWQTRNRILVNGKEVLLSVPVEKCPQKEKICDVKLSGHGKWNLNHFETIRSAYARAAYGKELLEILREIYLGSEFLSLVDLNVALIKKISFHLGIKDKFVFATQLKCDGKRSDHILQICKKVNADRYLSPAGSREYLEVDGFSERFDLEFQNFIPKTYPQHKSGEFVSHLSVVDVIANLGIRETQNYIAG